MDFVWVPPMAAQTKSVTLKLPLEAYTKFENLARARNITIDKAILRFAEIYSRYYPDLD